MGFFDSLRMAAHNLIHNKSRTLLTVVIVFVVSTLIMAMILIGTNFMTNNEKANRQYFDQSGTVYDLAEPSRDHGSGKYENYAKTCISVKEFGDVIEVARQHRDVVDSAYCQADANVSYEIALPGASSRYINPTYIAYDFPLTPRLGVVTEGPMWSAADRDSRKIWLDQNYVKSLAKEGVAVPIGTRFDINVLIRDNSGNQDNTPTFSMPVVVAGIIATKEGNSYNRNNLYMSIDYALSAAEAVGKTLYGRSYGATEIHFQPVEGTYKFSSVEKEMKSFVSAVNQKVGKGTDYEGKEMDRFSAQILEDLKMSKLIGLLILAVLVLLAFLILLLSVGSVANTIIISVDKNRKFIGLMKAMGLNNRGVKKITYKEATITILLGVLLAVLVVYLAKNLMLSLMTRMLGGLFGSMGIDLAVTFTISPFVPIGTFLVFLGMAILFSKGSLNKMGKADVISIISEVA